MNDRARSRNAGAPGFGPRGLAGGDLYTGGHDGLGAGRGVDS